MRLIHVYLLSKNTILLKSSYLTSSDLALLEKPGLSEKRRGRKGKEKEGGFFPPTHYSVLLL